MAAHRCSRTSWTCVFSVLDRRTWNAPVTTIKSKAKKTAYVAVRRKRNPRVRRRKSRVRITSDLPFGGLIGWLIGRFDHVADAAHGLDELLRKAVVDLAAKVADVNVHDVGQSVVIHVPDVLHDHGAAQRAALVPHHVFENAEFLGGQVNGLGGSDHFAAAAIER